MPVSHTLASLVLNREAFGENEELFNELERLFSSIETFQQLLIEDIEGNFGSNDETDSSRVITNPRTLWKTRALIKEQHTLRVDGRMYAIDSIEIDGAIEIGGDLIVVEL